MKSVKEIKDLIGEKTEARIGLVDKAKTEKRGLTDEENTQHKTLTAELVVLQGELPIAQTYEADVNQRNLTANAVFAVAGTGGVMDKKPKEEYNFMRALTLSASGKALDGFEAEMEKEAEKELRSIGEGKKGTFAIPSLVLNSRAGHNATGGATEGKATIETALRADNFIDVLYSDTWLDKVNANKLTGLTGNFELMRSNAKTTVQTVAENAIPTDSQLNFDKVAFSPGRISVTLPISKQLILQSSLMIQSYVLGLFKNDFAIKINTDALAVLLAATTENPLASYTQTNGIVLDYKLLTELEKSLAKLDISNGNFKWLVNPDIRAKAKNIAQLGNTISQAVWGDNGEMCGYPSVVTNLVGSTGTKGTSSGILSTLIMGNYHEFVSAQWGGMDITVDPYTLATAGQIRMTCDMFMGYGVTRPAAFTKCTQIDTR